MQAYRELEQRFARLGTLEDVIGTLDWDTAVMMPDGAADDRSEQLAYLRGAAHEILVAPQTADLLGRAESDGLDPWARANLAEMRRLHAHASAVPGDLVEAASRAASKAEMVWREARRTSSFALLKPHLKEVLRLQRQVGEAKGAALGLSPYDALLDTYDPGMRRERIDPLFAELRRELPGLVAEATEAQSRRPAPVAPQGPFRVEAQRALGERLMRAAGFDFERGRLDVSLHPFCGGSTGDVRITTRYDEADFAGALMGVLHETGHALYEQGRPRAWARQPVGAARGMTLHESQSLLVEMQACRSRAFVSYLAPLAREAFGGEGDAWQTENLYRLYTRVRPGFIRVDADEVTYPAHIVLRYDLETALIAGDMTIEDLPGAFNEGMKQILDLHVPDDRRGCLQDIHWPGGAWGYFPTYTLGAMTAAQLFDAACRAHPDIPDRLALGDFGPLLAWLRTNVHEWGSSATTDEIVSAATGRPLEAGVFREHLRRRYVEGA